MTSLGWFRRMRVWDVWTLPVALLVASFLTLLSGGCQKPAGLPESGALLLRIARPTTTGQAPDELRTWVYDDKGVVFRNVRTPAQGMLAVPPSGMDLGTILIQPGAVTGALRMHVRGLIAGNRVSDGMVKVSADRRDRALVDVTLLGELPADSDGDDVPDQIDDCLSLPNPDQGGCPPGGSSDGSPDGPILLDGAMISNDASAVDSTMTDAGLEDRAADVRTGDAPAIDAPSSDARSADQVSTDGGIKDSAPVDAVPAPDGVERDTGTDTGLPRKPLGSACVVGGECATTFCADGVCCQSACDQPCQQCSLGICIATIRRQDVPECAGLMTCNPAGKCVLGT